MRGIIIFIAILLSLLIIYFLSWMGLIAVIVVGIIAWWIWLTNYS